MKKLALSLAALGIVSTSALAGTLELKSVGQKLEYEHENRQPGGKVSLSTNVNLKYEDWSFGIEAKKKGKWNQTTAKEKSRRLTSTDAVVKLSAKKTITPEIEAEYTYEGSSSENNNTVSASYSKGIYSSNVEVSYNTSNKPAEDHWNFSYKPFEINYNGFSTELTLEYEKHHKQQKSDNYWKATYKPIGVSYEGINAKVVLEYEKYNRENELKDKSNGKLALSFPVYSEGNFNLKGNFDVKLFDRKSYRETTAYYVYRDFGQVTAKLSANYKVDENLSLNASVEYQLRNFRYNNDKDGAERKKHTVGNRNKQKVTVGWTYKL